MDKVAAVGAKVGLQGENIKQFRIEERDRITAEQAT